MTSRAQKRDMLDYLYEKLRTSVEAGKVNANTGEIVSGIESRFVLVGDEGLVFCVDQPYPNDLLDAVKMRLREAGKKDIAFVLFKDGRTFFRSGAKNNQYKTRGLTLDHYNSDDMHKIILLRPEEKLLILRGRDALQYYQPTSERLEQAVVTFSFKDVVYDRTNSRNNFGPTIDESRKLKFANKLGEMKGDISLKRGYLVVRASQTSQAT